MRLSSVSPLLSLMKRKDNVLFYMLLLMAAFDADSVCHAAVTYQRILSCFTKTSSEIYESTDLRTLSKQTIFIVHTLRTYFTRKAITFKSNRDHSNATRKFPWYTGKLGTREKRSAHACLPCFGRMFAIEIIRDSKTN